MIDETANAQSIPACSGVGQARNWCTQTLSKDNVSSIRGALSQRKIQSARDRKYLYQKDGSGIDPGPYPDYYLSITIPLTTRLESKVELAESACLLARRRGRCIIHPSIHPSIHSFILRHQPAPLFFCGGGSETEYSLAAEKESGGR